MNNTTVKILHCADLHLGSSFSSLDNSASQRSSELFETFDLILDICMKQKIDLLLIAGDFFDKVNIDQKQVDHVISRMNEIPETFVAIAPGNHDPYSPDSFYMLKKWPDNVYIFNGGMSYVYLEEKNVKIYGAGFTGTYSKGLFSDYLNNSTFSNMDTSNESEFKGSSDVIEICVIHGDLTSGLENSLYNPITATQIAGCRFDYIALGHVHKRTPVQRAGRTFYAYPGPPEGRGFDETGEMGVYIGTISKGACDMKFVETSKRRFYNLKVDIRECISNDDVIDRCVTAIKNVCENNYKNHFYKIILEGEVAENSHLNLNLILSKISGLVYYAKIMDSTVEKQDLEKLAKGETLKAIFAGKLLNELNLSKNPNYGQSEKIIEKAIRYGMSAFNGEVVLDEYQ